MALAISLELNNTGALTSYWRITKLTVDVAADSAHIELSGYKDKAARDAGKRAMKVVPFIFPGEANPASKAALSAGGIMAACYASLKASKKDKEGAELNPFSLAQDA